MRLAWQWSLISAIVVASPFTHAADTNHHGRSFGRRHSLSRMNSEVQIEKRGFDNARFTNFVTGQGACGGFNVASDFVSCCVLYRFTCY